MLQQLKTKCVKCSKIDDPWHSSFSEPPYKVGDKISDWCDKCTTITSWRVTALLQ